MKFALVYAASAALTPSLAAAAIPRDFFNRCGSLVRDFKPAPFVRVELSEALAKGTPFVSPDTHPSCLRHVPKTYTSDVCRLRFIISTSGSSSTTVEVLMPVDWKGQRFLMTGNAGLGGCVPYHSMIDAAALGFATVGHDNGHQGDTAEPFLNRPEVVKDYVYRSLQSATTVGKVAVAYFYKGAARKSYYMGCSTGGRQGMKAAQDFPEEFDGIISGAPAINLNNLFSDQGRHRKNMGAPGSPTFVSVEQWAAVNELVIKQCDHIDGVLDGVVEDPFKCTPRPERMLCRQGQTWTSHKCLTSAQVSAVRRAYEPFYNSTGGIIYPRLVPSSERQAFRNNSTTTEYMWDWFRYAVYNNPNWSPDDFSISTAEYSNKVDLYGASTWKDLTALKAQGTKLLMYHGLQDGLISAESSYQYYEHVS
ncbi:hypothetical protein DRE_01576 [Drechslerella stenobrocha 248]|uniref:Carboxylic ester hydrolase n=1 Tax=Drechslerella stenobrocha 248 TaxID=1043628 RepID=W7HKZ4_9PEZI|nr:hypothetical protein DRE_01576 [Drechslerella stenobrocha 248]